MVFFLMLRVSPLMPPTFFYANGFCSYANRAFPYANRAFPYAHLAFPYAPPPPRPFTSKTWLFLMLPCCTLHHNWLFLMLPPPPSFPPKVGRHRARLHEPRTTSAHTTVIRNALPQHWRTPVFFAAIDFCHVHRQRPSCITSHRLCPFRVQSIRGPAMMTSVDGPVLMTSMV